jgi:hypothetical protein
LGYSPEAWDAFTKEALGKGYKLEFLEVQVSQFPEDRPFDGWACDPTICLEEYWVFWRWILTNDKKAAKYLNSPRAGCIIKVRCCMVFFRPNDHRKIKQLLFSRRVYRCNSVQSIWN